MKSLATSKKIIFICFASAFIISHVMADNSNSPGVYDLPDHDAIQKEVESLIKLDQDEKLQATVFQKIKNTVSRSNGYIEITSKNAPNIYKLLDTAAKTIGIEIPSKVYLNTTHALNWNCCNACVMKSLGKDTCLSLGNKFLCELAPEEINAMLEHEFTHIKDKFLEQLSSKVYGNQLWGLANWVILSADLGLLVAILEETIYLHKYSKATLMSLSASLLLSYLLTRTTSRIIDNQKQIFEFCQKLEEHADLNVSSKSNFANGLKKVMAMLTVETIKYYPNYINAIIQIIEKDLQDVIIKSIDSGKLDSNDPSHPSLQNRLKYLKEEEKEESAEVA